MAKRNYRFIPHESKNVNIGSVISLGGERTSIKTGLLVVADLKNCTNVIIYNKSQRFELTSRLNARMLSIMH